MGSCMQPILVASMAVKPGSRASRLEGLRAALLCPTTALQARRQLLLLHTTAR